MWPSILWVAPPAANARFAREGPTCGQIKTARRPRIGGGGGVAKKTAAAARHRRRPPLYSTAMPTE